MSDACSPLLWVPIIGDRLVLVVAGMIHPGPQGDDVQRSGYAFENAVIKNTAKKDINICIIIIAYV